MGLEAMKYTVATFRDAGLRAKWTKTSAGSPIIVVQNPHSMLAHQRKAWWAVTTTMFGSMQVNGIMEGFDRATLIGNVFSIQA